MQYGGKVANFENKAASVSERVVPNWKEGYPLPDGGGSVSVAAPFRSGAGGVNRWRVFFMQQRALWTIGVVVILACASLAAGQVQTPQAPAPTPDVVYVGTPYDIVSKMLKLGKVTGKDVVYDLGCGDGRMIILAAKKYGCRGIGYDIDPERVEAAQANVKRNGVAHLVQIARQNIFTIDLSQADVLLLYLLEELDKKLVPQFETLKPGSRVVCHNYGIPGFEADAVIRVISNEDSARHTIFLYTTPLKAGK